MSRSCGSSNDAAASCCGSPRRSRWGVHGAYNSPPTRAVSATIRTDDKTMFPTLLMSLTIAPRCGSVPLIVEFSINNLMELEAILAFNFDQICSGVERGPWGTQTASKRVFCLDRVRFSTDPCSCTSDSDCHTGGGGRFAVDGSYAATERGERTRIGQRSTAEHPSLRSVREPVRDCCRGTARK